MQAKHYIYISCIALITGPLFFAFYNNWIIIHIPIHRKFTENSQSQSCKKNITLWYWHTNNWHQEKKELLWSELNTENLTHIITSWLTLLNEEDMLEKKISLQSVTLSSSGNEAYISFDHSPLGKQWSTHKKLFLLEGLLKTIRESGIKIQQVRFLVHHQPLHDHHLDFSRSWPVTGFLPENNASAPANPTTPKKITTIMLDPSGDAKNTGRIIDDTFERGLTLQYAQELQKQLEAQLPATRIILTRFPGESLEPLQNATFANRLNTDLYISINFYQETKNISQLFLYYCMYNPITDFWKKKNDTLNFYPYNQAHRSALDTSYYYANVLEKQLPAFSKSSHAVINAKMGIPFAPLIGVQAPAIGIEIGLIQKNDWHNFIAPVAHEILRIIG